jgi:cytochrome c oxidase subunit 3
MQPGELQSGEYSEYIRPRGRNTVRNSRVSIWMVLIAELMLFFGLISSFFFLRNVMPSWGPPTGRSYDLLLPLANTVLLLASAGTMHLAYRAIGQDRQRRFDNLLLLTMLLGAGFIAGQIYEFWALGFSIRDGAYAGIFLLTIGTHAAHVAVGVLIFVVVHLKASLGLYDARQHIGVEMCALYWYFVALVWLVIFPVLYFL